MFGTRVLRLGTDYRLPLTHHGCIMIQCTLQYLKVRLSSHLTLPRWTLCRWKLTSSCLVWDVTLVTLCRKYQHFLSKVFSLGWTAPRSTIACAVSRSSEAHQKCELGFACRSDEGSSRHREPLRVIENVYFIPRLRIFTVDLQIFADVHPRWDSVVRMP